LQAVTDSGEIVELKLNGNITGSQISNVKIASDQTPVFTTLSFNLKGQIGTTGLGNITIPKNAVIYETPPTIYIDGQQALTQDYAQNSENYYVWFTTQYSNHQIVIVFNQSPSIPDFTFAVIAIATLLTTTTGLLFSKKIKQKLN
jgi:hypothetical protein